jgi:cytidylate kinase
MYRAVTWAVLRAEVDPADAAAVTAVCHRIRLEIGTDPRAPHVSVDDTPVDGPIRGVDVTAAVSAVSAVPAVRAALVARQREIIAEAGNIVVEGRDIGTVVAPEADLKVYLTASVDERARRRSGENMVDLDTTAADLRRRDQFDSTRAADPLRRAADAVELDTTRIGIDEVVSRLREMLGVRA